MLIFLRLIGKFLKLLNSETSPWQLAAGVCFGMLVGFSPLMVWHNLALFLLVCLLRVNLGMFFLSFGIFQILAFALDPLFDRLGYFVLVDLEALRPFWIQIATTPGLPLLRWNNTIVIGSLSFGVMLFVPVFVAFGFFVVAYRSTLKERILKSKLMVTFRATKAYSLVQKYQDFRARVESIL